jgi:hypothetical protein
MKKTTFERFIKKYYLNGIIGSAVWVKESGILKVNALTSNSALFAGVTWKNYDGLDDIEFGIKTPKRLLALLKSIPSEEVLMDVVKKTSGAVGLVTFSAAKYKVQYETSCPSTIKRIPILKNLPPFNVAIKMNDEFIEWYLNACTAMGDLGVLLTVAMSQQTRLLEVYLGNYNRLTFQPETEEGKSSVKERLCFSAKALKEILQANPEFKDPILNVSDTGLALISFSEVDLDSQYYLVKIDVED